MRKTVKNTLATVLKFESRLVVWKYKPRIVAITGSVGKTSTKDAVYAVLSGFSYVRKSEKSFNSELGLPLTVLGCPNGWNDPIIWASNILKGLWLFIWPHKYPKMLVLEVGIGKPGDMKKTALWLKTEAVVMTAIGETPVHIEFFNSRKHLVEEKASLIKTLKKDGFLVLNKDDKTIFEMKEKTKNINVTYGFEEGSDIRASAYAISYDEKGEPKGITFRIDSEEGRSLPVSIDGVFGKNYVYSALAALGLASGFKLNMVEAIDRLKNYSVSPGRMRLLKGINGSVLIDDTYNSSPIACQSALETLEEVKNQGRKIAVLGDMLELGKMTEEAHKDIGRFAKERADVLVVIGQRAEKIKEGALESGMDEKNIFSFINSTEAGEFLEGFVGQGDLILLKGSQGIRVERTVEALLLEKDKAPELLARQDKEWKKRK